MWLIRIRDRGLKMNFGIIGCSGIADRRTIPGMMKSDRVKIIAVEDVTEDKTSKVAKSTVSTCVLQMKRNY